MSGFLSKARTAIAIGLPNIARVAAYKTGVRSGLIAALRVQAQTPAGQFFKPATLPPVSIAPAESWQTEGLLFSYWRFAIDEHAPNWHANPLTGKRINRPERHWWEIPDFDPDVGDIKLIWELSRMDWVLAFAQRARNGDEQALTRLNLWLADWCTHNPPYRGPNWKCGQEASIRVMHLAMAAIILGQTQEPAQALRDLVRVHLLRIAPTVRYAMAQDNNHGTSEAAALFIGGSWLAALGDADGSKWQISGRRWLEDRATHLIGADGSFSQYSLNYHRVVLDTFCMAEVWRLHMAVPAFSAGWRRQADSATRWLYHMINPVNGDGPNLGANDGARLLQLTNTAYRDYRPSVQLATHLFAGKSAYAQDGPWNHPLHWLGLEVQRDLVAPPATFVADDGGFAMLRHGSSMVMLRYPRFRFRPSQADALHLDLWLGGENLMRDGGSYSYNTEARWLAYFGGTESHNTVQFDDRDQMPRISRFLFGDWLKTTFLEPICVDTQGTHFSVGYRDSHRASHRRRVSLTDSALTVIDDVAGFAKKAVLRWRVAPGAWRLDGHRLTNGRDVLAIQASCAISRCQLIQGWESRHYAEKTPLPVLEVELQQAGTITTVYSWEQ
jgi:Heparinase II/III-like protein/Heparinase II/III N-terminus